MDFFESPSELTLNLYADISEVRNCPARQFVRDLKAVILLKQHLTRRQWISMLESLLRLGTASHVFWIAAINMETFDAIKRLLAGEPADEVVEEFWKRLSTLNFLSYGQYSARAIKNFSTGYLKSRVGINLLLHLVNQTENAEQIECDRLGDMLYKLATRITPNITTSFWANYQTIIESDSRIVQGKKGSASNISEFLRHVLGKRQTSEPGLDSYDQGYYLSKRGKGAWEVSMGPVAVLTLVHACTAGKTGTTNIEDFFSHLQKYGIELSVNDVSNSTLSRTLRNLGIVVDSPDAEGGMVLLSPFESLVEGDN